MPTLPLAAYAGRYEHSAYGEAVVRFEKEQLKWEWSSFKRDLFPFDGETFELRDVILDDQDAIFIIDGDRPAKMKALGVEFSRKSD
jgi:hypothetical protein